jgi:hypothetical protein
MKRSARVEGIGISAGPATQWSGTVIVIPQDAVTRVFVGGS